MDVEWANYEIHFVNKSKKSKKVKRPTKIKIQLKQQITFNTITNIIRNIIQILAPEGKGQLEFMQIAVWSVWNLINTSTVE